MKEDVCFSCSFPDCVDPCPVEKKELAATQAAYRARNREKLAAYQAAL